VSLLLGSPTERLSLSRAVDSLGDAARLAGRPSLLWLVGAMYPSLNLNFDLVRGVLALVEKFSGIELPWAGEMGGFLALFAPGVPGLSLASRDTRELGQLLVLLPLVLMSFRMIVGLARVSDPLFAGVRGEDVTRQGVGGSSGSSGAPLERPRRLHLRHLWQEGKGLATVAFGLWGMLLLLLFGAMLVLIAPLVALLKLVDLARFSALSAGLLLPVLLLVLAYASI